MGKLPQLQYSDSQQGKLGRSEPAHSTKCKCQHLISASADLVPLATVILKGSSNTMPPLESSATTMKQLLHGHYVTVKGVSYSLGHDRQQLRCYRSHHLGSSATPMKQCWSLCDCKNTPLVMIASHYATVGVSATPSATMLIRRKECDSTGHHLG